MKNSENNKIDSPSLNDEKIGFFHVEKTEPMFGQSRRDWSVDVLRCLSCFIVCAIHSSSLTWANNIVSITDLPDEYLFEPVYRMILASPTVLFVMISGIFFLSPERRVTASKVWRKNILKMAFAYAFWSYVYARYRIYTADITGVILQDNFFKEWIVQPFHLWYIPMIIGLYVMAPILRPITATYDEKLFKYIIAIFMMALTLWTVYYLPWASQESIDAGVPNVGTDYVKPIIDSIPMNQIAQYPFWMIYGWIAYNYRPNRKFRFFIYFLGIASILVGIQVNIYTVSATGGIAFTPMTQKFGILMFFKNTALFYFVLTVFRNHEFSKIGKVILRKWSDCTLIIYLIHYLILCIMFNNGFLYSQGVSPWIAVWVYAGISYFGGGVIAVLFHLIWDPINKTLFGGRKRSEKIYRKLDKKHKETEAEYKEADNNEDLLQKDSEKKNVTVERKQRRHKRNNKDAHKAP